MFCLRRPYLFKLFKGYLPQKLLSQLWNTLSQIYLPIFMKNFTTRNKIQVKIQYLLLLLLFCEGGLTEKEIFTFLISFENNESPGNDGPIKEFYCVF